MTRITKWLLAAACAAILFPAAAQAQYPYGGYGYGGWGPMNYGQGYFSGTNRVPPYFALHPPVYYSHEIIRRPMGPSPFAYPSWYSPPSRRMMAVAEAPTAKPLMVVNPYVAKEAAGQASREIINPYVVAAE